MEQGQQKVYTCEGARRYGLGEGGTEANGFTQGRSRCCKRVGSLVDVQSEASTVHTGPTYRRRPSTCSCLSLSLSACLPQTTCLPAEASPSLLRGRGRPFSGKNFPGDLKKKRGRMRGAWKVSCDVSSVGGAAGRSRDDDASVRKKCIT